MDTTRMNLVVEEDIPEILATLAGGERKRGEYLTQLVRDIADGKYILRSEADELIEAARLDAYDEAMEKVAAYRREIDDRLSVIEDRQRQVEEQLRSQGVQLPMSYGNEQ